MKNVSRTVRAPWQLLGNAAEWQVAIWRRWLLSQMRAAEQSSEPDRGNDSAPPDIASNGWISDASVATVMPEDSAPELEDPAKSSGEGSFSAGSGEARARLDWMCDRLVAVEAALDRLGRRSVARELEDRRAGDRTLLLLERITRAAERQTNGIDGLLDSHAQLEQRLAELEREICQLRLDIRDGQRAPATIRPSRRSIPPAPNGSAQPTEFPTDPPSISGFRLPDSSYVEPLSSTAASIHGNLAEMSLSTILAMFELERRTGVFTIQNDTSVATIEMVEGAVARSRMDELPVEPVDLLRQALHWDRGTFWFNQRSVALPAVPPRPLGSLLLEATHRNDEAVR